MRRAYSFALVAIALVLLLSSVSLAQECSPGPQIELTITPSAKSIDTGGTVTFHLQARDIDWCGDPTDEYDHLTFEGWSGDTPTGPDANGYYTSDYTVTYNDSGEYSFTVTASDDNGVVSNDQDDASVLVFISVGMEMPDNVLCVSPYGSNSNSGLNWQHPKHTIQAAIDASQPGGEVWVAAGSYAGSTTNGIYITKDVKLYGGFAGVETLKSQRNLKNNNVSTLTNTVGRIMTIEQPAGIPTSWLTVRVDGFTFADCSYGGLRAIGPQMSIMNNTFKNCSSSTNGGAIYAQGCGFSIYGNIITNCSAPQGAAIYVNGVCGSCGLINNTIVDNTASVDCGGVMASNLGQYPYSYIGMWNNIVAYNTRGGIKQINGNGMELRRNCVYSNTVYDYSGVTHPTDINNQDPSFVNRTEGNYHIASGSPCIDAGEPGTYSYCDTDIDSEPRKFDGNGDSNVVIDVGSDEYLPSDTTAPSVSIESPAEGAEVGTTFGVVASATDAGTGVFRVEAWLDNRSHKAATLNTQTGKWECQFSNQPSGAYTLHVKARDGAGNEYTADRQIYVAVPPTVSISSPSEGTQVEPNFLVAVSATDQGSGVQSVEVWTNNNPHQSATYNSQTGKWEYQLTSQPVGALTIHAKATDVMGNYAFAGDRHVTVVDAQPWTDITIVTPEDGETIRRAPSSASTPFPVSGTVNALTGMQKIQLRLDSGSYQDINMAQDYNASTGVWKSTVGNLAVGSHTIYARACDSSNNVLASASASVSVVEGGIIFVDAGVQGGDGTGSSWQNAFASLNDAITSDEDGSEIWVKSGSYTGDIWQGGPAETYGGFNGTEIYRAQRDWVANETIIRDGTYGIQVTSDADFVLDGFTITNTDTAIYCSTDTASATIAHNKITGNISCGIYCQNCSVATIANNIITNNGQPNNDFTGIGVYSSFGQIINNAVAFNSGATVRGIDCDSRSWVINNTISHNIGTAPGSAIRWTGGADGKIINNLVAYNSSGIGYTGTAPTHNNNCVYKSSSAAETGLSYLTSDVYIIDDSIDTRVLLYEDGIHIEPASPCHNAGDNNALLFMGSSVRALDIDQQARILDNTIDIGADESTGAEWYSITLDPAWQSQPVGTNAVLYATVSGMAAGTGAPVAVSNRRVDFQVTNGIITGISPNGSYNDTTGYGITGNDGKVEIDVTRYTEGVARITAKALRCDLLPDVDEAKASAYFYEEPIPGAESWPMFHHDVSLSGVTTASVGPIFDKMWSLPLATGNNTAEIIWSSPIAAGNRIYVGCSDANGTLYSVTSNGDPNNVITTTLGSPIQGTPCLSDGVLYVGTMGSTNSPAQLFAIDANSLQTQWTYLCEVGEQITGSVTVYNGAVYFGTNLRHLHTIDLTTLTDRSNSPAVTPFGISYATPGIDTTFPDGARAYITDLSCWVTAIDCTTGAWQWQWAKDGAPMYASPTVFEGYIYVGSGVSCLYRLADGDTAATYREVPTNMDRFGTSGAVYSTSAAWDGRVFFGSNNGYLYAHGALSSFAQADGWSTSLGAAVTSSPAISSDGISSAMFIGDDSGKVRSLDPDSGSILQTYDVRLEIPSAVIKSSPALMSGHMYIVVGDTYGTRYLYCFGN